MLLRTSHNRRDLSLDVIEAKLEAMNQHARLWLSLMALLLLVQIGPWWYSANDGCRYLSIARSIARGESITALGSPQLIASPGYPLLISPAFFFGDRPFLAISVIHWLLAVACLLGVYVWAKRVLPGAAVTVTGLAMLNMAVWCHYRVTLKEIAFLAVLVWTVNSLAALQRAPSRKAAIGCGLVATGLMTLLWLIRYTGVVLLAGFGISLCLQAFRERERRTRSLVLLLALGVPVSAGIVAFMAYERHMAQLYGGATYATTFLQCVGQVGSRSLEMFRMQIESIGQITIPGMFKAEAPPGNWLHVNMLIFLALVLALGWGWWDLGRRKGDVFALTLPFYVGLYVVWDFDQGPRFMVPMTPLFMGSAAVALQRFRPARFFTTATCLLLAHLVVAAGFWLAIVAPRARADDKGWPAMDQIAAAIQRDPGLVAFCKGANAHRRMLELALDRPVETWDQSQPIREETKWLIASKAAWKAGQPPAPFRQYDVVQDFIVFRR